MNPLLATLGAKLTERWLNLLVLPGALFLAVATASTMLGHRHWYDLDLLRTALADLAVRPAMDRTGAAALLVAGILLAAAAASLTAQFLGGLIEQYWLRFARDPISHALVEWRKRKRKRRDDELQAAFPAAHPAPTPDSETVPVSARTHARIHALTEARDRIALRQPTRPTWYGDRMQATADRVEAAYGVDLAAL
ncbi:hypothetical protein [Streptomyces sp. NPDC055036]